MKWNGMPGAAIQNKKPVKIDLGGQRSIFLITDIHDRSIP